MEKKNHFLLPGNLYISTKGTSVSTILGSCVSICLWDEKLHYGGINHYILPLWNGRGLRSPKYGNIAINRLIEKMYGLGCEHKNLKAKVFGGASVLHTAHRSGAIKVGQQNILLATDLLEAKKIPIVSSNLGGNIGRKIIFDTELGVVMMRKVRSVEIVE